MRVATTSTRVTTYYHKDSAWQSRNQTTQHLKPQWQRICFFLMLICSGYALSQAGKTELVGEVRDQNGALIPSARITLIAVATQQAFSETTKDGNYLITNLKPDTYNLRLKLRDLSDQFKRARLATGERIRVATVLDPGVVSELVPSSQQSTAQLFQHRSISSCSPVHNWKWFAESCSWTRLSQRRYSSN